VRCQHRSSGGGRRWRYSRCVRSIVLLACRLRHLHGVPLNGGMAPYSLTGKTCGMPAVTHTPVTNVFIVVLRAALRAWRRLPAAFLHERFYGALLNYMAERRSRRELLWKAGTGLSSLRFL